MIYTWTTNGFLFRGTGSALPHCEGGSHYQIFQNPKRSPAVANYAEANTLVTVSRLIMHPHYLKYSIAFRRVPPALLQILLLCVFRMTFIEMLINNYKFIIFIFFSLKKNTCEARYVYMCCYFDNFVLLS